VLVFHLAGRRHGYRNGSLHPHVRHW
jgi:hypothetical protein